MSRLRLNVRAVALAIEIAGLMCAPETLPRSRITPPTVHPKAAATMSKDSNGATPSMDVAITEPGPSETSRYVPSNSEKLSFLQLAQGIDCKIGVVPRFRSGTVRLFID